MKVANVSEYRQLAAFGDTVLAAKHSENHGFEFVTWKQNADGRAVFWGDYSPNYEYAKESFAVRSGLIPESRLFSEQESPIPKNPITTPSVQFLLPMCYQ